MTTKLYLCKVWKHNSSSASFGSKKNNKPNQNQKKNQMEILL